MWVGSFDGRNGLALKDVAYTGSLPAPAAPGQRIAARYFGGQVIPLQTARSWVTDIMFVTFVGAAAAAFLWLTPLGMRPWSRSRS